MLTFEGLFQIFRYHFQIYHPLVFRLSFINTVLLMFHRGFWDIAYLDEYLKYELSLDLAIHVLLKCI